MELALIILSLVVLAQGLNQPVCKNDSQLIPHKICNKFYKCVNGVPVTQDCPVGLRYNILKSQCDLSANVECIERIIDRHLDKSIAIEILGQCLGNSGGKIVPNKNCNKFNKCVKGIPVPQYCPAGHLYNINLQKCDLATNVDCKGRIEPEDSDIDSDDNSDEEETDKPGSIKILKRCTLPSSEGKLLPSKECNQFKKCANGVPVALKCPTGLLYNIKSRECDWAKNVDCKGRLEPANNNGSGENNETNDTNDKEDVEKPIGPLSRCALPNSEGRLLPSKKCNEFKKCANGIPVAQKCPVDLLYNIKTRQCDWPANVDCRGRIVPEEKIETEGNNETDDSNDIENTDKPSGSLNRCALPNSEGRLLPSKKCNEFKICANGIPVAQKCPAGLLYNIKTRQCDWPAKVDCRGRILPEEKIETEGNNETAESNDIENTDKPSGSLNRCALPNSEGRLLPSKKCNEFRICANGIPVAQKCPAGLLYNIKTRQCDWPAKVDCRGRIVPEEKIETEGNNETDDSNDIENTDKPSGSLNRCALPNSEGRLLPSKKCNEFRICANGIPVAQKCPAGLLYNIKTRQCDWPAKVDCRGRILPEEKIETEGNNETAESNDIENTDKPSGSLNRCALPNSEGRLLPSKKCNEFRICANGIPVAQKCPAGLLYNIKTNECDWPNNVNCKGRIKPADKSETENSNETDDTNDKEDTDKPSGPLNRCALPNSEGRLLPSKKCNEFKKCANGVPVPQNCPVGLLYNIKTQQCDWPANVDCWGRIKPKENIDTVNGGETGGGNESGDDSDTFEILSICALPNSEGKVLPNKNCNQFNKCANGKPVPQKCPVGLLYNIFTQECDWPQNVNCKGRVLHAGLVNQPILKLASSKSCTGANSEGRLVPHKICNQFFKCSNGIPVAQDCPIGLQYNVFLQFCDWPHNVDCTGRIVP